MRRMEGALGLTWRLPRGEVDAVHGLPLRHRERHERRVEPRGGHSAHGAAAHVRPVPVLVQQRCMGACDEAG